MHNLKLYTNKYIIPKGTILSMTCGSVCVITKMLIWCKSIWFKVCSYVTKGLTCEVLSICTSFSMLPSATYSRLHVYSSIKIHVAFSHDSRLFLTMHNMHMGII